MRVYYTTRCIIFYLLVTFFVVKSEDLFDMFNDIKDQVVEKVDRASTKVKEKVQKHVFNPKDSETCPSTYTTEYRTVLTAYRHLIKDWIEKFPSNDAEEYRLLLQLSPNEFNRLKKFASSAQYEQKDVLHEVHTISDLLKRIVYKIEEDKSVFSGLTWSAWLRTFDINEIIKVIFVLLVIGGISFISIRTHLRRGRWFTTLFIVAFIVSVVQNWYTLDQEARAKVDEILMKKLPKHCQGQTMGMFDMIKAKFGRFFELPVNPCFEHHKALRATSVPQVTPVQAISMTCAQLFVTPLGTIGESLSHFFAGTMRHIPIVVWPIIIILILLIVVFLILMYSKYEIHLPFMMGSIRPSPHHAAITRTTNVDEQIENSSNRVQELENKIQKLQSELQQKNLQLEHNTTHVSRSTSIGRTNQPRERSLSNRRPNTDAQAENELRQRTTSPNIGFRQDLLPE